MKRMILVCVLLVSGLAAAGEGVVLEGVKPGEWTMDFAAAKKEAKAKKLPILLNFSGSDWCGWCKRMEESVFSKEAWKAYAREKILMVVIDSPRDESIVPEKYRARNEALKQKYKVEGFPTFFVLAADGETVLGKLGAGEDTTPASFIEELKVFLRYQPSEVDAYCKTLPKPAQEAYRKLAASIYANRQAAKAENEKIAAAQAALVLLQKKRNTLEEEATALRVKHLPPAEAKTYHTLKDEFDKTRKEFEAWLATNPERNEENTRRYQSMAETLQRLSVQLRKY